MRVNSIDDNIPYQPDNPTDFQRRVLSRDALAQKGRLDDYDYIFKLMSPPQNITTIAKPGAYKNIRVGIIGGGLAGMSAAYELRKLGFDITIFEAEENRIGGRVYTHYFNSEKTLYGEYGPMRMPVTHETLWHYINLFKLQTRPFIQVNENALIYLKKVRVRNDPMGKNVMEYIYPKYDLSPMERKTPWQQLGYYGFESPILKASSVIRSEILQVKPFYNPYTRYWDSHNIRQILESQGLSQGAINLLQNFYPLAGQDLYNSYIDYVQEPYSVDLSYLYEIPGGTVRLPQAFYNSLTSQNPINDYQGIPRNALGTVALRMGNWVEGIYRTRDDGKVTLAYRNKDTTEQLFENFDYIICAIPFSTLRTVRMDPLFSGAKMQAIREINYINAQKSFMVCKYRFWEMGGPGEQIIGGASYTDLPISQIYYPSDHARYCKNRLHNIQWSYPSNSLSYKDDNQNNLWSEPGVLLASYNFSLEATRLANMKPNLRFEEIKREIEMVHGLPKGSLDSIVTDFKIVEWNSEPWFRGALCFYTPEQKQLFSYAATVPEYDGKIFFAGEHISAKHRWMQGALQSGMQAANALASGALIKR